MLKRDCFLQASNEKESWLKKYTTDMSSHFGELFLFVSIFLFGTSDTDRLHRKLTTRVSSNLPRDTPRTTSLPKDGMADRSGTLSRSFIRLLNSTWKAKARTTRMMISPRLLKATGKYPRLSTGEHGWAASDSRRSANPWRGLMTTCSEQEVRIQTRRGTTG